MSFDTFLVKVFDYFTNSKKSIGKRLGNFIIFFLILIIVDLSFNISYGIHQNSVLDKLEQISEVKETYKKDKKMTIYLDKLEYDIINRKHPYDLFDLLLSSLSFSTNNENDNTITQNIPILQFP